MPVKSFSTTAGSNSTVGGVNISENNLTPPNVNNALRALMADIRSWYEDAQFLDFSHSPTFATTTRFRLVGYGDLTSVYHKGRRLRLGDASVLYGTITDATHSADTAITMSLDTGNLSASLSSAAVAILTATNHGIPTPLLLGDGVSASAAYSFVADPDTGFIREAANQLALVVGGAAAVRALSDGNVRHPLQTAFLARNSVVDANATGAGGAVTIEFDTEVFDINADFNNTTDTFTAPVAGLYLLGGHIALGDATSAGTNVITVDFVCSTAGSFEMLRENPAAISASGGNNATIPLGAILVQLAAGETVSVSATASNGTATVDINTNSRFWAILVA